MGGEGDSKFLYSGSSLHKPCHADPREVAALCQPLCNSKLYLIPGKTTAPREFLPSLNLMGKGTQPVLQPLKKLGYSPLPFTLPPIAGFVLFSAFFLPPSLPTTAANPQPALEPHHIWRDWKETRVNAGGNTPHTHIDTHTQACTSKSLSASLHATLCLSVCLSVCMTQVPPFPAPAHPTHETRNLFAIPLLYSCPLRSSIQPVACDPDSLH